MGSVTDLINLAEFELGQQQRTPDNMNNLLQAIGQEMEKANINRKKRNNQKRLSDMILKDIGNLDTEYKVGETGAISISYKRKKKPEKDFAGAVKKASQRISQGEEFEMVTGELASEFPKLYKDRTDAYLRKFEQVKVGQPKESVIEPRAEGLGRIGRGAKYGEAITAYGKESTDRVIGVIQDYQKEGKTFAEISKLMQEQGINPELFLKFYR
ncbi:hypothetical protein LCGC14_1983020 [marine sediment metagenome]|uniref:Uncharacterized protein n=1 Tax=marine sediment metagenome TaxID=412755 RepID=A0A0F9F8J2_9ZZZZ